MLVESRDQGTEAVCGRKGLQAPSTLFLGGGLGCTLGTRPCIHAAFLSLVLQPPVYPLSYWMESLPIHSFPAFVYQIWALLFVTKSPAWYCEIWLRRKICKLRKKVFLIHLHKYIYRNIF